MKGQVNAASVHIKQPHKTLRYTRQLSFDEVFYNIHVLEINSYITSEVFLTNIKYVWHSCYQEKSIFPSYKAKLNLTLFSFENLITDT